MKVSELIKQLSKYPQDMNVFGYSSDMCMGEQISDIKLCVEPVFIDSDSYDQSVCIGYESVMEDRVYNGQDTELFDVLIAYPCKIVNNDLTKESA